MYHVFFIQLFVDRPQGWFYFLAIMKEAINVDIEVSLWWGTKSFGGVTKSGRARLYGGVLL